MKPTTLEEALVVIEKLEGDKTKILGEKKGLLETLKLKDEDMTENEKAIIAVLESERAERLAYEQKVEADNKARQDAENGRVTTSIEDRITKIAKGDTKVADHLRANIALLEKMPRTNDGEIDALATAAFNMMGTKDANPLAATNNTAGGQPKVDEKPSFSDTAEGKGIAGKLGMTNVAKADEGGDDK